MRFGVVTFPGGNGDHDALTGIELGLGEPVEPVWYRESDVSKFDCLVIPGGFSYGDYLRPGAIARFAPVMESVTRFAERGGPVLGICNGFQVLTEAGLLPGALLRNGELEFRSEWVHVRVENNDTSWTEGIAKGDLLRLPIAHGDGRYYADDDTLRQMQANGQIVFRYVDSSGAISDTSNPNGSVDHIAGVSNRQGNVVGLMPHPERAHDVLIGGDDGLRILGAVLRSGLGAIR